MKRSRTLSCALLLPASVVLGACAKRPALTTPDPHGEVGYRFITTTRSPELASDEELASPRPRASLELPVYPASALEGGAAPSTVAVRIVIGTDGTVIDVLDSPRLASTAGPFAAEFRRAVDEAVRRWVFSGGTVNRLEDGEDYDGDGEPQVSTVSP